MNTPSTQSTKAHPPRKQVSKATSSSLVERARVAPRLTREEERDLIMRWQTKRDRKAADQLARCSLRYVVAVAFKHRRYDVPLEVLISEGNLGLVRAMEKFDLEQDTRFSTYATYWIRYYIIDYIMRSWSLVGGGSGALKTRLFFRLRRERARAWNLHGESELADQLVAERMNLPRKQLSLLLRQLDQRDLSLNLPASANASSPLMDTLGVDAEQESTLERARRQKALAPLIEQALEKLSDRERLIVEKRLMADSEEEQSLSSLGEKFGVSRERVRQIEDGLKRKIRAYLEDRYHPEDLVAA